MENLPFRKRQVVGVVIVTTLSSDGAFVGCSVVLHWCLLYDIVSWEGLQAKGISLHPFILAYSLAPLFLLPFTLFSFLSSSASVFHYLIPLSLSNYRFPYIFLLHFSPSSFTSTPTCPLYFLLLIYMFLSSPHPGT